MLAAQYRLVAINSAIEVDLTGQVNSETAASRYVGAVGGATDFLRGAARSEGGIPVIALPSTASPGSRGTASRIVAALSRAGPKVAGQAVYLSSVTDPYLPAERSLCLTRGILEELLPHQPRLLIQMRGPLVVRDVDVLRSFRSLRVNVSLPTDSEAVRQVFEPKAPPLERRWQGAGGTESVGAGGGRVRDADAAPGGSRQLCAAVGRLRSAGVGDAKLPRRQQRLRRDTARRPATSWPNATGLTTTTAAASRTCGGICTSTRPRPASSPRPPGQRRPVLVGAAPLAASRERERPERGADSGRSRSRLARGFVAPFRCSREGPRHAQAEADEDDAAGRPIVEPKGAAYAGRLTVERAATQDSL